MINEIKRRLENGETVELECIDECSFANNKDNLIANQVILNQHQLLVESICYDEDRVYLRGDIDPFIFNAINFDELKYFKIKEAQDEVDALIQSRSNGAYSDIAADTLEIMRILGLDSDRSYSLYQIIHKVVRIRYGYSVEDSLLDIAGYAKLELERLRNENV